jgi:ABC-type multidrug transport system fused ATPase/permease subunit
LQAWLIPKLQRQINRLNKSRIKEVRQLAALIGESAVGSSDLRTHGGWRYRLAMVTEQLGVVYRIRFQIYQKKFFMKFLNNFITQLTPFFFFSVGGYLVIQGAVSLGALVAALAAYKDLSSPWKELLTYYNQAQDMSLRWDTVMEKFSPVGVIDDRLMDDAPEEIPRLSGPLKLDDVSITDADGTLVLDSISVTMPGGALVGIAAPSDEDRRALADVLTRELTPVSGLVSIGGQDLKTLHQATLSRRIGHANSNPVLFAGTFGQNAMMAVCSAPSGDAARAVMERQAEALAAGNSADPFDTLWLDPKRAGVETESDLRAWWMTLIEAIGSDGPMFRKSLDQIVDAQTARTLQDRLVDIRPKVWAAIEDARLDRFVFRFDPERYNPALPVASNLLYATLKRPMSQQELAESNDLFDLLRELELEEGLLAVSREMIELLGKIFGTDGMEHPLFRKLGLDPVLFERSVEIIRGLGTRALGDLTDVEKAVLMTLPAQISAEQIGPAFTAEMQQRILTERLAHSDKLMASLGGTYAPLAPDRLAEGLSVLENALFGKVSHNAGGRADDIRRIVSQVLEEEGLKPAVIDLIYDLPLSLNGSNLPATFAEPLALLRAAIKRPDILVMEQILTTYDHDLRVAVHKNLRRLLPDTTLIYIADHFEAPERFDVYAEITQGRMVTAPPRDTVEEDSAAAADLQRKVRALESTDLFSTLDRRQLRLLAFGARWFQAEAGDIIFRKGDDPMDGAYMILAGSAELYKPQNGEETLVAEVGPGTIVGELGLIRKVPRALTMRASDDLEALRLGAEEFLAVVENDAATSFKLLQVVAGYTAP